MTGTLPSQSAPKQPKNHLNAQKKAKSKKNNFFYSIII